MAHNVPSLVQTEDRSYVRDTHSKALLNTDVAALTRHRAGVMKTQENMRLKFEVKTLHETCRGLEARIAEVTLIQQQILATLQKS